VRNFLDQTWAELRERRLWPVALLLVLALVAVPVLVAKPAEEPAPAAPPPIAVSPKAEAESAVLEKVELVQEAPGTGSTLGLFDPSDPFRPPKDVVRRAREAAETSTGTAVGTPGETTGGSGGADTGSGGSGGSGGGGGTGGVVEQEETTEQEQETVVTQYEYVVDLTFIDGNQRRKVDGMRKLEMLPNEDAPLLIFMGVTPKGSNAVFMVDSTLKAAGEGRCKPSHADCAFVYIGPGSEHAFTDPEGKTYTLRIDEIRKVKVVEAEAEARKETKTETEAGAETAGAAVVKRRFQPPLVTDVVIETEGQE
jgi:hypothetical protein